MDVSKYTGHVIICANFEGKYNTILFNSEKVKVKDLIGWYSDFSEEFMFANDGLTGKNLEIINLKNYETVTK